MGSKKKADKQAKKKGPKGKKARAKAKLERQWGEVAIVDEENTTKRIGNSRHLAAQKKSTAGGVSWGGETTLEKKHVKPKESTAPVVSKGIMKKTSTKLERINYRRRVNDGSSSSSDESSDEELDNETMPLDLLMSKIKKVQKKKKVATKYVEEDDDVDIPMQKELSSDERSAESLDSEEEEDDDASMSDQSADADDVDDNVSIENDEDESAIDIFRTRFSRKPLTSEEVDSISQPSRDSVSIGGPTELLLTGKCIGDELKDFETSEKDQSKLEEHWKKCAMKNLGTSRKVLNKSWKKFNSKKDFTSRQAPLYTALSSYADLFSITNSIKVCCFEFELLSLFQMEQV